MSYKFKIGDQVVAISPPDDNFSLVGHEGIVTKTDKELRGIPTVLVHFDKWGGWYCEPETLQLAKDLRESELK